MSRIIPGLLLLIAVTALPQAALAADAVNGEKLAKRWCAACHVVASDQKSGNTQVAPFSAIAKMPDMNLSRSEAADLTAYIVSQGK